MAQGKSSKKFWTAVVALTVFAGPTALGAKAKSLKPAKKATPTQKSADPFQGNGETGDKETNPSGAKKSPPSNPSMIPLETTATLGAPSGAGFFDLQITSMTYKSTYGDSVATDANGNVYVAGDTNGGLDGNTLTGTIDFFVTKYNSSGVKQ